MDSPPAAQCGRRAHPRLRLHVRVQVITLDGQAQAILENVSATGARIATQLPLKPGMSCILRVAGLELLADVSWSADGRCGLAFDGLLAQDRLLALRELAQQTPTELQLRKEWARNFVNGTLRSGN